MSDRHWTAAVLPAFRSSAHIGEGMSRRQFVSAAGVAGALLASGACAPVQRSAPEASLVPPKPIPGGTKLPWGVFIHHYPPKPGETLASMDDPSQITDFSGLVTNCRIFGMGLATDTKTGATTRYPFMTDMGIMQGDYVGEDGHPHRGTFGFI
jgi:hypothetical protein